MKYATAFSFLFFIGLALPQITMAQAEYDTVGAGLSDGGTYTSGAARGPAVRNPAAKGPTKKTIACLKRLTRSNGCFDSVGGCKEGFQYCLTDTTCKNNGGEMDNGTCVARGTASGNKANSDIAAACAAKGGTYSPDQNGCYCSIDASGNVIRPEAGGTCGKAAATAPAQAQGCYALCIKDGGNNLDCTGECFNPASPSAAATGNHQLDQCLQKWETKAEECKSSAERAVKSCDEDKSTDEGAIYVRSFAKDFLDAQLRSKAGTGSASECARGSLIGNTALNGMNSMKITCSESFGTCNQECEEVNEASRKPIIANECGQFAITDDEKVRMSNTISTIITASLNGIEECTVDAKKQKGLLEQALDSYGKAAQAGKMCECNISGAGANCNLIPDASKCLPGGALYGQSVCNVFTSCALGSQQYNTIPCQCARDSSAAVCRTLAGKPAPSNFALDLKPSTNGGVDVGGPAGGAGDDTNMNLGGNYNVNKPGSDYKDPAEIAKGGKSGGGGNAGGGGGGGGGSRGEDPNAGGAGEDDGSTKGGLAGLFNQAKSSFSNMLGGGSKVTGKGLSPNGGGQGLRYDINKWRPRGLASAGCQGNQVRCKNEDIFTIVNRRYDVNERTFIYGP